MMPDDGPNLTPAPWSQNVPPIAKGAAKQLRPAAEEDVLAAFGVVDEPERLIADRSTLENYATCPAKARLIETGAVVNSSHATETGQEVHDAIAWMIHEYIASSGECNCYEELTNNLRAARPDVQPDALAAAMPGAWAIADYIRKINPANIMAVDGGDAIGLSGQLSWDVDTLPIRVTSELDFLQATSSPLVVLATDWKSGRTPYTETKVETAFQFTVHAVLVLETFPDIDAVDIQVWETRKRSPVYPVRFTRARLPSYETRVRTAAGIFYEHRTSSPQDATCWPTANKCEVCSVAARCPLGTRTGDIATDPQSYAADYVALSARVKAMGKAIGAWVDAHGGGAIVTAGGDHVGRDKPSTKKSPVAIYKVAADHEQLKKG